MTMIKKLDGVITDIPFIKIGRFTFINFKFVKTFKILYRRKNNKSYPDFKILFSFQY
jgi:hypothetical protein